MEDTKRKALYGIVMAMLFFVVSPLQAHDPDFVKIQFHREYMIYQPTEDVLHVLKDYEHYDNLFPDIDKVSVQTRNNIHTIVHYDVKVLRKNLGALMEFTEKSYGNITVIKGDSIRLYKLERLDGILMVYDLGPKKTKLVIDANIKPGFYVPQFIINSMVEKTFDNAVRRLKNIAWQHKHTWDTNHYQEE